MILHGENRQRPVPDALDGAIIEVTVRDLQFELGAEKGDSSSVSTILTTDDRRKLNALLHTSGLPTPPTSPPAVARRTAENNR